MKSAPPVVPLDAAARTEALTRGYAGWPAAGRTPDGAGAALLHAFAHIADTVAERINRVPDKNLLAFLELVGARVAPPQTARVPLTFTLAAGATADVVIPERTQVAAVAAPGEGEPSVFETERDLIVTGTQLVNVLARDAERDRYADRGAGERPFGAFDAIAWIDHRLYVAHDILFGLAESFNARVRATGLATGAQWPWMLRWERWTGDRWASQNAAVERLAADSVEIQFDGVPAIPRSVVAGRQSRWLRARLDTSIPRLGAGADTAPLVRRSAVAPDALEVNGVLVEPDRVSPFVTDQRLLLRSDETLSKPGARVTLTVRVDRTVAPEPTSDLRLRWQCFDGTWKPLGESTPTGAAGGITDTTRALTVDGTIGFSVPLPVPVLPQTDERWLLVEVVAGGYGATPPVLSAIELSYEWPRPRMKSLLVSARLERADSPLESAFTNVTPVDLSKDFLPFGPRPAAGDALYLACDDAFTPPRTSTSLTVKLTTPPGSPATATPPQASPQHDLLLRWEYFDAVTARWTTVGESGQGKPGAGTWQLVDGTEAFTKEGAITLTLPAAMGAVSVNGVSRRWLRVRIARGDYNVASTLNNVPVLTPQPPSIKAVTTTYAYIPSSAVPADCVVTENDFAFARLMPGDGGVLTPFTPSGDEHPTLYLGFDRPFSNQQMTLYFGVEDVAVPQGGLKPLAGGPPVVVWEFWSGEIGGWSRLETRDETRAFTSRGLVSFIGPPALSASVQMDQSAHWLRARWLQGSYLRRPVLERILTNTTWASHRTMIDHEVVGSSTGRQNQTFRTARAPVLPSERVEVRELEAEDAPWTVWTEVVDFHGSGPADRHYTLDRITGELRFGDGVQGRIPARARENVRFRVYRTGGGASGNRASGTISRLLSTLSYVDAVTNHEPARGGVDADDPEALLDSGPRILRHRGRAVVASDFEDLAREASPALARATAITGRTREASGAVGVVIVPTGTEARPLPTPELVERVDTYVRARCAATFDVWVTGPGWVRVDLEVELVPTGLELATNVENAVRVRLRTFLHPLTGGTGDGWPLGRRIFRSDLLPVVEGTTGVDHVRTLRVREVTTDPAPVTGAFIVYSGEHRIRVVGSD